MPASVSHNETKAHRPPAQSHTLKIISSMECDRIAIYDPGMDSYLAMSTAEGVRFSGLTKQQAEDWVNAQLVLLENKLNFSSLAVVGLMVVSSWAVAVAGIWGVWQLFV